GVDKKPFRRHNAKIWVILDESFIELNQGVSNGFVVSTNQHLEQLENQAPLLTNHIRVVEVMNDAALCNKLWIVTQSGVLAVLQKKPSHSGNVARKNCAADHLGESFQYQ